MIFTWIGKVLRWILMLFVPPRKPTQTPGFDPNALCIACGTGKMTVKCVTITSKPGAVDAVRKVAMVFTCQQCAAYFYGTPLCGDKADLVHGVEVTGL